MKEIILMVHPALAVFGVIASVWVFVEVLNISEKNVNRARTMSLVVSLFTVLTWATSGFWYIVYYAADKAIILKGPWAFAHNLVMESKEHVFFSILVLSLYLPIVTYTNNLVTSKQARLLVMVITALIVLISIALEGAGAVISFAVRMGLIASAGVVTPY